MVESVSVLSRRITLSTRSWLMELKGVLWFLHSISLNVTPLKRTCFDRRVKFSRFALDVKVPFNVVFLEMLSLGISRLVSMDGSFNLRLTKKSCSRTSLRFEYFALSLSPDSHWGTDV